MTVKCLLQGEDSNITTLRRKSHPVRRILVVEDDPQIRMLNTAVLIHFGYKVDAAEDGDAAWQALTTDGYHLLITDNRMPKVSGVELIRKMGAAGMAVPVIMATGTSPKHEFVREPWLLPSAILLKPYTSADLLGTVAEVLRVTHDVRDLLAPPPIWRGGPSAERWKM